MRVTILNQFYPPDLAPTAHLAASLAAHRAALGDEVTVVTGSASYVDSSASAAAPPGHEGVRVRQVSVPGGGKASVVTRLLGYFGFHAGVAWQLLRLPRQDVVVSLTTPPYLVIWPMLTSCTISSTMSSSE
jgi:colanic acid biosynthesis glycosyl transferase WcaI